MEKNSIDEKVTINNLKNAEALRLLEKNRLEYTGEIIHELQKCRF